MLTAWFVLLQRSLVLDDFRQHISEAAMHDSLARYPPPWCHPRTREKILRMIMDWVDRDADTS